MRRGPAALLGLLLAAAPAPRAGSSARAAASERPGAASPPAVPPRPGTGEHAGARVEVRLLGRSPPRALTLRSGRRTLAVAVAGGRLLVDGREAPSPLLLEEDDWQVRAAGAPPRRYQAALRLEALAGRIALVGAFPLERYVAAVVASEAAPGTPPAALAALAVVVRSWALAARGRHDGGRRCDLAHCQVLRGDLTEARRDEATAAAATTAGQVLRLPGGRVAASPFHAACGGHTADPGLAFGGEGTGAAAAPDPACPPAPWTARLTPAQAGAALRGALARAGWPPPPGGGLRAADLALTAGPGGWVAQVSAPGEGWRLSGDAAARSLDAALGRGRVRSSRFEVADVGGQVVVRGEGHGHGVGLCQAGASARARAGQGWRAILGAYFPGAAVAPLPWPPALEADAPR